MLHISEKWYFTDNSYTDCMAQVSKIVNDEAYISIYKKNNDAEYPWKEIGGFNIKVTLSHVAAKKIILNKWDVRMGVAK